MQQDIVRKIDNSRKNSILICRALYCHRDDREECPHGLSGRKGKNMHDNFEYPGTLPEEEINRRMKELSDKIGYKFCDISWLERALYTEKITDTNAEKYANSPMATLGDRVLSLMITEDFFDEGKTSQEITEDKAGEECNSRWCEISAKLGLYSYAFKDRYFFDSAPRHEQLPHSKHDRYFEALAAAIYKDSSCFEKAREIIEKLLEKAREH